MASIEHIYTSFPKIQWDGLSDVSHLALSHLIGLLLPQRHLRSPRAKKIKRGQVMRELEALLNRSSFNVFVSGLLREDLAYPDMWSALDLQMGSASCKVRPNDLNVMMHRMGLVVSGRESDADGTVRAFATTQGLRPGNLRLYVDNSEKVLPLGIQCQNPTGNRQYLLSQDYHETCLRSTSRVNGKYNSGFKTMLPSGTEVRFGVKCKVWPRAVTSAWERRAKACDWPPEETINKITSGSCHVAPCVSETWRLLDEDTDWRYEFGGADVLAIGEGMEWKFCFSLAEATLADCLSNVQRQAFMMFTIVVDQVLGPPHIIKVHHLKALFYRVCEKITATEWQEPDVLAYAVLTLLDDLFYCFITNRLFDYFLPDINLLEDVHEDFLIVVRKQLSGIREIPVKTLLDIFHSYKFQFTPANITIWDAFQEICEVNNKWLDDDIEILEGVTVTVLELVSNYFKEGKIDEGLGTCQEYCSLYKQINNENYTIGMYLNTFGLSFPQDMQLRIFTCFLEKPDINDPETAQVIHNLMQIRHALIKEQTNAKQKAILINDTVADYRKFVEFPGLDDSIQFNYALFLWALRNAETAVPVLESLVAKRSKTNKDLTIDVEMLDKSTQAELKSLGALESFPVLLMTCYFLAKCYAETNANRSKTDNFMSTFDNLVWEEAKKKKVPTATLR